MGWMRNYRVEMRRSTRGGSNKLGGGRALVWKLLIGIILYLGGGLLRIWVLDLISFSGGWRVYQADETLLAYLLGHEQRRLRYVSC
jgi:hypothetical protein